MNEWQIAACGLLAGIGACTWVVLRGRFLDSLVALNLATVLAALTLLVLAEGESRQSFGDLALALAAVSVVSSLIFARYLERVGSVRERREGRDG